MSKMASRPANAGVPWWSLPLVAVVSFVFGGWLLGDAPADSPTVDSVSEEPSVRWTCAMHPQIQQKEPGTCPICGMELVEAQSHAQEEGAGPGVVLSERAKALARLRTERVTRLGPGGVARRLLGRVDFAETGLRTVTAWIGGRIDRLHVSTTGEVVKRGQVIATMYSPEVYSAHQDLIQAAQQLKRMSETATPSARRAASAALEAARDRLRLIGIPDRDVAAMERAQTPSERVRIRSPFKGTVIERLATQGNYVETGSGLYRIADLSRLWVQLDAYESDLSSLRVGQEVALKLKALPGERFAGHVTFVDPVLDSRTRTTRVRIEVKNNEGRLRPGMFVEAAIRSDRVAAGPLVVPSTAPLFTGRRTLVYVETQAEGQTVYEAREVELGGKIGDHYPVTAGLKEGDRVVVNGAFAIDADLQIRGVQSMMSVSDHKGEPPPERLVPPNAGEVKDSAPPKPANKPDAKRGTTQRPKPKAKSTPPNDHSDHIHHR